MAIVNGIFEVGYYIALALITNDLYTREAKVGIKKIVYAGAVMMNIFLGMMSLYNMFK